MILVFINGKVFEIKKNTKYLPKSLFLPASPGKSIRGQGFLVDIVIPFSSALKALSTIKK